MKREFTGKHMTAVLVGGFGIVFAVNMVMATLAVRDFGGVVVENSYVASQKFNGWLDEARRQERLGWQADLSRTADGRLSLATANVPDGAKVSARIRHPLGRKPSEDLDFAQVEPGRFLSDRPLPGGRWIVRLTIWYGGHTRTLEEHVG